MNFLINHWGEIIVLIVVAAGVGFFAWRFLHLPKSEQEAQIKAWLLQAVLLAEKEYGSGTGRLKLSAVYGGFCEALPWLAKLVTFELFSQYVDEVLDEAKAILSNNKAVATFVDGGDK